MEREASSAWPLFSMRAKSAAPRRRRRGHLAGHKNQQAQIKRLARLHPHDARQRGFCNNASITQNPPEITRFYSAAPRSLSTFVALLDHSASSAFRRAAPFSTLMLSWSARSTISLRLREETLWAISAAYL